VTFGLGIGLNGGVLRSIARRSYGVVAGRCAVNRALTNQRETKYVRGLEKMMEQPAVPANVVRLFA
jgi:hypothetical protein